MHARCHMANRNEVKVHSLCTGSKQKRIWIFIPWKFYTKHATKDCAAYRGLRFRVLTCINLDVRQYNHNTYLLHRKYSFFSQRKVAISIGLKHCSFMNVNWDQMRTSSLQSVRSRRRFLGRATLTPATSVRSFRPQRIMSIQISVINRCKSPDSCSAALKYENFSHIVGRTRAVQTSYT